jgi:TonB family protein
MILWLANHLWQSTLYLAAAALIVRLLKQQDARWRYAIWLSASFKFLLPFAVLIAMGSRLPHPAAPTVTVSVAVQTMSQPFTPAHQSATDPRGVSTLIAWLTGGRALQLFGALWVIGCAALVSVRIVRRRHLLTLLRRSVALSGGRERESLERMQQQLGISTPVRLQSSESWLEPAVVGVLRPTILWPSLLTQRLTDRELDAIFAHELLHVRRRDNLTAAVHALLETVFWFHPALWWLETRLLTERERACDEAVVRLGNEPHTYARSILKVCNFCLRLPASAAAGVTGADLNQRVEDIMNARPVSTLNVARKMLLIATGLAFLGGPVVVGSLQAESKAPAMIPSVPAAARTAIVAQTSTGRVSGVITDPRGNPISGAHVSAIIFQANAPVAGGAVTAETNDRGEFALDLPPAEYELRVEKPGFTAARGTLFVTRGALVQRNLQLRLGTVEESIRVVSASDSLEQAKKLMDSGQYQQAKVAVDQALTQLRAQSAAQQSLLTQLRAQSAAQQSQPPVVQGAQVEPERPVGGAVRVGGDVAPPKKIHDVPPVYPQQARDNKISGIVIIDATIGTDGAVKDANILRGQPLLNQAALDAVTQWRFTPTLLNGSPVDVMMTVTVNFQLQ